MSLFCAPSLLSGDFSRMGDDAKRMEKAGADYLHCDVMDGVFVPNLTFGPKMVADIKKCTTLPLDVHLMIVQPEKYIEQFIKSGADLLSFHIEATSCAEQNLRRIRELGAKAGIAISPNTPVSDCFLLLPLCDFVVVMGVHPGFSGQSYIPETTARIAELRAEIVRTGSLAAIEVDGGVNESNVKMVASAGATILVSGSCAFSSPNPEKVIEAFKNADK